MWRRFALCITSLNAYFSASCLPVFENLSKHTCRNLFFSVRNNLPNNNFGKLTFDIRGFADKVLQRNDSIQPVH